MPRLLETLLCWVVGIGIGVGGFLNYSNPHFEQTSGYKPAQVLIGSMIVCLVIVLVGVIHLVQPQGNLPEKPVAKEKVAK